MRGVRADLIAHLGGSPSAVQRALIDRIAMLSLHVALFDARAVDSGTLNERDSRAYLAYSNSLSRALRLLGLKAAPPPRRSLSDVVAADRAERERLAAEATP
jgi:hypothetical protein